MISPSLSTDRFLESIASDGAEIGRLCRSHPARAIPTCPEWTGADLLAHLTAFSEWLRNLWAGSGAVASPLPVVESEEAARNWDRTLTDLLALLRETDPRAPMPNWSSGPQTAAFWLRRCAQDVAIHRWDAARLTEQDPDPVPADIALDGIDEYLHIFITTAFATGSAPEGHDTLRLEITDLGHAAQRDLPHPGPVTVLRGSASDLLLGLWHRRDPLELFADGNRQLIAQWPHI